MDSRFSLRWNNYASQITEAFGSLLLEEDLVDVTLSCEGKKIKAHKMLLSACSPYFHGIFKENPCQHPVIVFKNVPFADLKAIVQFIYCGEVNVVQEQLESFLNTAGILEVKGLTDRENENEVEANGTTMTDEENTQIVKQKLVSSPKRQTLRASAPLEQSSPPTKKRKSNVDELPEKGPGPIEEVTVVKKEMEEVEFVDVEPDDPEPFVAEVQSLGTKISPQGRVAETSSDAVKILEEPSTKEVKEKKIEGTDDDPSEDTENGTLETKHSNVKQVNSKTAVPLKKRKNIPEEDILLEDGDPEKSESKIPEMKCAAPAEKTAAPPKTVVKGKVQIPKSLIVTSVKAASQVEDLFDFPVRESQVQDEAYAALRSEEATTPVHEEPMLYAQDTPMYEEMPPEQHSEVEPEIAEEAPFLQNQTELEEPVEEEVKEPEFDYFGCEICKSEAKPVDLERISFTHKCPICPCCCFCAHLLKEHMKVIHGWFNVQRRFTQY